MLDDGSTKSNLGDLLRSGVILECIDSNYLWLTDELGKQLMRNFIPPEQLLTWQDLRLRALALECDLAYNLDNFISDKQSWQHLSIGEWRGFVPRDNQLVASNDVLRETTAYRSVSDTRSWQESLVRGLGFEWQNQDYPKPLHPVPHCSDVGLNWRIHPDWVSKHWPKEHWEQLAELIEQAGMSVSWQQGENALDEYITWLSSCATVVSGESLGVHLASALRKQVIALTGPVSGREHPYDRLRIITPTQRACMPCNAAQCHTGEWCMREIAPQEVFELARAQIGKVS